MLADIDEPLVLADGTKIDPKTGKTVREKKYNTGMVEIPAPSVAQEMVVRARRSAADMPLPGKQMNTVSLVCFYTMWGLNKTDIAIQLGMSLEQLNNIQQLPEYQQLRQEISRNILEHDAGEIRGMFQQKARMAANKIFDTVEEEGVLGFKAAQDILDRAGHRPADIVEHRVKMSNTLQIEVVEKKSHDIPTIDAEFEVV